MNFVVTASLDSKKISPIRKHQLSILKKLTNTMPKENSHDIVIPIATNSCPTASPDWHKFSYYTHNLLTPIATAQVYNPFPFDLSFAMTVHKAQGRTIKQVILDLTEHANHYAKMEFAAVFVAMSRVGSSKHIRLLSHSKLGTKFNPETAYQYLTKLHPDRDVQAFNNGFSEADALTHCGQFWNPMQALSHTT